MAERKTRTSRRLHHRAVALAAKRGIPYSTALHELRVDGPASKATPPPAQDDVALRRDWRYLKADLIQGHGSFRSARGIGISRTLFVPASATLDDLAMILCIEFDRPEIDHLYTFVLPREELARFYEGPVRADWEYLPTCVKLAELDLQPSDKIEHVFDMGDQWRHRIGVRAWSKAALTQLRHEIATSDCQPPLAGDMNGTREVPWYVLSRATGAALPQYGGWVDVNGDPVGGSFDADGHPVGA